MATNAGTTTGRVMSSSLVLKVGGDGAVRLFLVADGLEVRMPMAGAARHLEVLEELLDRVYRECPDAAYVDLRYAGQAVVGRRGAAARQRAGDGGHG